MSLLTHDHVYAAVRKGSTSHPVILSVPLSFQQVQLIVNAAPSAGGA